MMATFTVSQPVSHVGTSLHTAAPISLEHPTCVGFLALVTCPNSTLTHVVQLVQRRWLEKITYIMYSHFVSRSTDTLPVVLVTLVRL